MTFSKTVRPTHINTRAQSGFSLVELMITLTLGLVIAGAVIQVLVSSSVTNTLNQAVAQVQESGRKEVIAQLIESGNAYRCYCTPEEVEAMREEARAKGVSLIVFLSL